MKTLGFVISEKENEKRRALIPADYEKIANKEYIFFEKGYFGVLGISDNCLEEKGYKFLNKEEIYKCDIIVDPKIGDSEYLDILNHQTIFGWVHATQNYDVTQKCIDNHLTAYAWEKMFERNRHSFSKNNQTAGKAAVLHAMTLFGTTFADKKIAILGNGNTSKGAQDILKRFDTNFTIYGYNEEEKFKNEFPKYNLIINCILWDTSRKDHILYTQDLIKMEPGTVIIDVSCDHNGGIQSSHPTTIKDPVFIKNGIYHYAVDHTPSILFADATKGISEEISKYADRLITGKVDSTLKSSLIIENGTIIDKEINLYQNRQEN